MIQVKNDLALFVAECLKIASRYVISNANSVKIQSIEYSNIGIFIDLEGALLAHPLQGTIRSLGAGAIIDECEATIMLHYNDVELQQVEMFFDAGHNLERWNRRIDEMRFLSGF